MVFFWNFTAGERPFVDRHSTVTAIWSIRIPRWTTKECTAGLPDTVRTCKKSFYRVTLSDTSDASIPRKQSRRASTRCTTRCWHRLRRGRYWRAFKFVGWVDLTKSLYSRLQAVKFEKLWKECVAKDANGAYCRLVLGCTFFQRSFSKQKFRLHFFQKHNEEATRKGFTEDHGRGGIAREKSLTHDQTESRRNKPLGYVL